MSPNRGPCVPFSVRQSIRRSFVLLVVAIALLASYGQAGGVVRAVPVDPKSPPPAAARTHPPQHVRLDSLTKAERAALTKFFRKLAFVAFLEWANDPTGKVSDQPCGGTDYPPCWRVGINGTESGGRYDAYNPTGCSGTGCFGKYQFGGFWAGKLGLPIDIARASPWEQDNAARILWDKGRGCGNWSACG